MTEYPAMIYKTNRNKTYIANCFIKNIVGFGKTEEEALRNLRESLSIHGDIYIKPVYGLSMG
jgi:predicted RNase H-like HicB family nuclease